MKTKKIFLIGLALCLVQTLTAQSYLQDTIPETVVTATGTVHLLKDVPVQTEVITNRMLQDYAGRSLEDILGGLTAAFAFNEDDMGSQSSRRMCPGCRPFASHRNVPARCWRTLLPSWKAVARLTCKEILHCWII